MKEIEITEIPALRPNEQSLLQMHSLLNLFNVLRGEITLIGLTLADDPDLLKGSAEECSVLIAGLRDLEVALAAAALIEEHIAAIRSEISAAIAKRPEKKDDPELRESLANLESVFAILRVHARELLARAQAKDVWSEFAVSELQADFMAVFAAIERNSHGHYRLLYNAALQCPPDYYIDFRIDSTDDRRLWMPAVFQDVMRDLIANARKYTPHGGRITAALHAGRDLLRFHVEDTGRGIPEEELARVVEFGYRAANVSDVRTMGGGFGLTKAFFVTKQFGGRFFIASALGIGTRIRIHIPRPANVGAVRDTVPA